MSAVTNTNKPCFRMVLVRYPQFGCHETEIRDGVPATRSPAPDQLTELGEKMLDGARQHLKWFIFGRDWERPSMWPVAPAVYTHDKSARAVATLERFQEIGGCRETDIKHEYHENYYPPKDAILPIVMFCSTATIRAYLKRYCGIDASTIGPPLMSVTMFDTDTAEFSFVHTIGNTRLYPDVCWWNNASA